MKPIIDIESLAKAIFEANPLSKVLDSAKDSLGQIDVEEQECLLGDEVTDGTLGMTDWSVDAYVKPYYDYVTVANYPDEDGDQIIEKAVEDIYGVDYVAVESVSFMSEPNTAEYELGEKELKELEYQLELLYR